MAYPTERQNVEPLKFNFDPDPVSLERARQIYDATSFDLKPFKARGGKIIMWHGMADGGIPVTSSIGYYKGFAKLMGGRQATEAFFRLFLLPGVHHCFGGPGPSEVDALTALENWVEKGHVPDVLIAEHATNGVVDRTRPAYPYPMLARYSGSGDPTKATSFVLVDPTKR